MGKFIVKIEGTYLEWGTIVDAPVTFGMPLEEFKEYYREEYGSQGMRDLDTRLARADERGTSSHVDENADEVMWLNRAGPGESSLSRDEIVEFYVRRREDPKKATLDEYRQKVGKVRCSPCPQETDDRGYGGRCEACWGSGWKMPEDKR